MLVIVLSHGETAGKKTSLLHEAYTEKSNSGKRDTVVVLEKCHWRPH